MLKSVLPAVALLAGLAGPAMAQVSVNTITETQIGAQTINPLTQTVTGVASISQGDPLHATIYLTLGSACAPSSCPLNFLEVGFEMAGFSSPPPDKAPFCTASLMDGAFYPVFSTPSTKADEWPAGTTLTVNRDALGLPAGGQGWFTYYIRVKGPPLGNPTLNQPAAVFQPGAELRLNADCDWR
jgi:hypothetical protein